MNKKQTWLVLSALLAFSILYTLINYLWIEKNISHLPPPWDPAWYIYMSLNNYDALWNGNISEFLKTVMTQDPYHGPLFPAIGTSIFIIFGPNISAAYLINAVYLFILFSSVFFITEKIAGRKAAMLAVFITATFPTVTAASRDYLFEFPLAALTALSYLFLIRSDSFSRRKESVFLGISSGLSILTKTMGIIFFVFPFLYAGYTFIRKRPSKEVRKNIILSFSIALILASLFYVPNFRQIFWYLFEFGFGEGAKPYSSGVPSLLSIQNWTIYLKAISWHGISVIYTFVFLIAAIAFLFLKDKKLSKDYLILWLWFLSGYFILSLSINKGGARYALPILAPIAIIMATHIISIPLKSLRYAIIVISLIAGALNFTYQSRSELCRYKEFYYKNTPVFIPLHMTCAIKDTDGLTVPYNRDWDIMPILQYMDSFNHDNIEPTTVFIAFDHYFLNGCTLQLYSKLGQLKGLLSSKFIVEGLANKPYEEDDIKRLIHESYFIMTKTGFQGPDFSNTKNHLATKLLKNNAPVKDFVMTDGSTVSIYRGIAYKK
ncbi:MAG: glycosyltransferase family 39 protein [Thermodesulfovibrionales bacterium]